MVVSYHTVPQHLSLSPNNPSPAKSASKSSRESHSDTTKRSFASVWWFELACCVLAVCMLGAIVAILVPYQEKPLPSLPYHLSINTLVSICVTVLKMCGVIALAEGLSQLKWEHFKQAKPLQHLTYYDAATRGPMGCLQLLSTFRCQSLLTMLGAIVSILVIIIDPFAQQLIAYYSCNVPAVNGTVAYIPRSSYYNELGYVRWVELASSSLAQQSAVLNGLFNSELVRVPVDCPTGNCTFHGDYATLSFCSACTDVTHELQMSWQSWNDSYGGSFEEQMIGINTSLPSGVSARRSVEPSDGEVYLKIGSNQNYNYSGASVNVEIVLGKIPDNATYIEPDEQWYARWFGVNPATTAANQSCDLAWQNHTWGCRGFGASRCTIDPCVKVLNGSMSNGTFMEHVINTYSSWFQGWPNGSDIYVGKYDQMAMVDLSCINASTKNILVGMGYNVTDTRFMPYNVAIDPRNGRPAQLKNRAKTGFAALNLTNSQISLVPSTCVYQMDWRMIDAFKVFINGYLNATLGPGTNIFDLTGSLQAMKIFNGSYMTSDSINEIFTGMADSLSIRARQWDADGKSTYNQPAQGVLWVTETCIHVQWPWLTYPVAVTLSTVCFFAFVLQQTETSKDATFARGWKSSLLPLIYHGMSRISADGRTIESHVDDIQSMTKAVENEKGCIQPISTPHGVAKLRRAVPLPP